MASMSIRHVTGPIGPIPRVQVKKGQRGHRSDSRMRVLPAAGAAALLALFFSHAKASPANDWRFALTTLSGREVTMDNYRGKWLLVYFGYTFCPDVCPATLTELVGALKALDP